LHALAALHLSKLTTSVKRIVLGRIYNVTWWLQDAYQNVCERVEWLTEAEAQRLGLDDVFKIASARDQLRYPGKLKVDREKSLEIVRTLFAKRLVHSSSAAASALDLPPGKGVIDPADDTTEATILTSLAEHIESPVITALVLLRPMSTSTIKMLFCLLPSQLIYAKLFVSSYPILRARKAS
jgi:hypothetical protein